MVGLTVAGYKLQYWRIEQAKRKRDDKKRRDADLGRNSIDDELEEYIREKMENTDEFVRIVWW